jgi:hypothetical protein
MKAFYYHWFSKVESLFATYPLYALLLSILVVLILISLILLVRLRPKLSRVDLNTIPSTSELVKSRCREASDLCTRMNKSATINRTFNRFLTTIELLGGIVLTISGVAGQVPNGKQLQQGNQVEQVSPAQQVRQVELPATFVAVTGIAILFATACKGIFHPYLYAEEYSNRSWVLNATVDSVELDISDNNDAATANSPIPKRWSDIGKVLNSAIKEATKPIAEREPKQS